MSQLCKKTTVIQLHYLVSFICKIAETYRGVCVQVIRVPSRGWRSMLTGQMAIKRRRVAVALSVMSVCSVSETYRTSFNGTSSSPTNSKQILNR